MTNDSKLGLLAGVAAVLLIAVVYHQKGPNATIQDLPATPVNPKAVTPETTPPDTLLLTPE